MVCRSQQGLPCGTRPLTPVNLSSIFCVGGGTVGLRLPASPKRTGSSLQHHHRGEISMSEFKAGPAWFKTIHDHIPVGIFRTAPAGRLLSVNPAMAAIHGYDNAEEMMQIPAVALYQDPTQREILLKRLAQEESISEMEIRFKRKDGTFYWGSLTARKVAAPDGSEHIDGIIQDISKRKAIEAELQKANDELDRRVRERTSELSEANDRLKQEVGERERLHEQLIVSQKNLALANADLEKAILNANQMAADAEARSYELEMAIEKRKQGETALRESENRYRTIIESIEDGYCEIDLQGNFIFFNDAVCNIFGYGGNELKKLGYADVVDALDRDDVVQSFTTVLESGMPRTGYRFEIVRQDGEKRQVEASISLIQHADGNRIGFRGIVRDVEERRKYEARLVHQAYHDPLTGLKNRKAFYEKMPEAISYAGRYGTGLALLYIDIDKFKQVNDALGHESGDLLLQEISARLKTCVRHTDFLARLGGDEFAVILNNPIDIHEDIVAQRIVTRLSDVYRLKGHRIDYVSASIGASLYPSDADDIDNLVNTADLAMYRAKKTRNRFVRFADTPD
jgi:diguanylate cyclase (GGDEF)-like protein/PAS domain S-box-containing protein